MRGFTLIEVLITIFLLTVGVVGVLAMFPLGTQTTKSAQMASQASHLGQFKIEEMVSKSYDDPALSIGTTTEDYGTVPDFSFHKRVTSVNCVRPDNLSETECNYDLVSDPDPMKKIEVTVYWKSSLGITERNVKLTSLIAKK